MKIISSYDVVFDGMLSSTFAYTLRPCSEEMDMHLSMAYTPYATSSIEQTGVITMFTQFEEGNLLSETCNDVESSDKSDDDSIIPPLLSKA